MRSDIEVSGTEKYVLSLRDIYGKYGYSRYKMSKFEEYSLYSGNLDFLVSDRVITFTDTDGKLMALKPDVTLSIVKNVKEAPGVKKVCYNENVYRVSKGSGAFKEILQTGVECIGDVDPCLVSEVLELAALSLDAAGGRFVLEVSHLGVIEAALEGVDGAARVALIKLIGDKNYGEVEEYCREHCLDGDVLARIKRIMSTYGKPNDVALALEREGFAKEPLRELCTALSVFEGTPFANSITVDFSLTADMNYYNGIVFKGFVEGAPDSVLSGGQYDRLMKKMGRRSKAVGFAVYVDALERRLDVSKEYDFDVMLIYSDGVTPDKLKKERDAILSSGKSVYCCRADDGGVVCRETVKI